MLLDSFNFSDSEWSSIHILKKVKRLIAWRKGHGYKKNYKTGKGI